VFPRDFWNEDLSSNFADHELNWEISYKSFTRCGPFLELLLPRCQ